MNNESLPLSRPLLRRSPIGLVGLLLLAAGCGVNDYELKMQNTQNRVKTFDEENKLLDFRLTIPDPPAGPAGAKEKAPTRPPIFLRPPKGISRECNNEKEPSSRLAYFYPAKSVGGDVSSVQVAVSEKSKTFQNEVLALLSATPKKKPEKRPVNKPPRDPLVLESSEYEDPDKIYHVNFLSGSKEHDIAILYTLPKAKYANAIKAINASLDSLAIGNKDVNAANAGLTDPLRIVPRTPPPR